jgi:hypothetical protein
LSEKPLEKWTLGRPNRRWKDNVKVDLNEGVSSAETNVEEWIKYGK